MSKKIPRTSDHATQGIEQPRSRVFLKFYGFVILSIFHIEK